MSASNCNSVDVWEEGFELSCAMRNLDYFAVMSWNPDVKIDVKKVEQCLGQPSLGQQSLGQHGSLSVPMTVDEKKDFMKGLLFILSDDGGGADEDVGNPPQDPGDDLLDVHEDWTPLVFRTSTNETYIATEVAEKDIDALVDIESHFISEHKVNIRTHFRENQKSSPEPKASTLARCWQWLGILGASTAASDKVRGLLESIGAMHNR